jgi:hypothetical protein
MLPAVIPAPLWSELLDCAAPATTSPVHKTIANINDLSISILLNAE